MAKAKKVNPRAAVLKVLKGEAKRLANLVKDLEKQADEKTAQAREACESAKENLDLELEDTENEIEAWLEEQTERLQVQQQTLADLIEAY